MKTPRSTRSPESKGVTIDASGKTSWVMVVDDDVEFRTALAALIRSYGYDVKIARDGLEALDILRWGFRPSLILLDLQMRTMTGWDFRSDQLKDDALVAIPVVAMTAGYWKSEDHSNFAARLSKPIDLGELMIVLRKHAVSALG